MSLMSKIFGSNQAAQEPAGNPNPAAPAQNPPTPEPGLQQSSVSDPTKQTSTEPSSPLAEYAELYKIEPPKDGDVNEDDLPFVGIDPEKLKAHAATRNFTTEDLQEQMQSALQGDTKAFAQVLNSVAQQAFLQAAEFSESTAERAAKTSLERSTKRLPKEVRSVLSYNELSGLNEDFKDPALAPLVNSVRQQFEAKYPDAGPREIATAVNKYLTTAAEKLGAKPAADPTQRPNQQSREPNFAEIFGHVRPS